MPETTRPLDAAIEKVVECVVDCIFEAPRGSDAEFLLLRLRADFHEAARRYYADAELRGV